MNPYVMEREAERKRREYLHEAEQHRLTRLADRGRRPVQGRTGTVLARILLAYGMLFRPSRVSLQEVELMLGREGHLDKPRGAPCP